jgi:DNA-binding transcriptional ArsR family regulator
MKNIVVASVGEQMEPLFVGLRQFPTEKVILLSPQERKQDAERTRNDLEKFKIPGYIVTIDESTEAKLWENTFRVLSDIKNAETDKEVLVNIETGDKEARFATMSGAFVNGMKAFSVSGERAQMLPVMKFSYYKLIPDKKMEILKILHENNTLSSLDELSKRTKMSLPLISYHINGNLKSEGLKSMGLIETKEQKGRVSISLSLLGRMVVQGYVN